VHKRKIAVLIAIAWIVLTTFCSVSFAEDQSEAFIEAACKGDLRQVQELLEKGADINAEDRNGLTALDWTSKKNMVKSKDCSKPTERRAGGKTSWTASQRKSQNSSKRTERRNRRSPWH
jgi:hypothetical protein